MSAPTSLAFPLSTRARDFTKRTSRPAHEPAYEVIKRDIFAVVSFRQARRYFRKQQCSRAIT